MLRAFKTRYFARWAEKVGLSDASLRQAVMEMARGLIDADLGGGVVKKRVPLPGRGKRGGARTLVATRRLERWFFLVGFQKNEQDNIDSGELASLRDYANELLGLSEAQLAVSLHSDALKEVFHEHQQG